MLEHVVRWHREKAWLFLIFLNFLQNIYSRIVNTWLSFVCAFFANCQNRKLCHVLYDRDSQCYNYYFVPPVLSWFCVRWENSLRYGGSEEGLVTVGQRTSVVKGLSRPPPPRGPFHSHGIELLLGHAGFLMMFSFTLWEHIIMHTYIFRVEKIISSQPRFKLTSHRFKSGKWTNVIDFRP